MSTVPVTPTPAPTTNDIYLQIVQSVLGLLGVLGVAVPPVFTSLAAEQQIAGIVAMIASLAWAAYHRLVTKPVQIRAAAIASARTGEARKPV